MKIPIVLNELFSIVSYNGNEQATKNKDKYLVDNVLKKEVDTFHCSGKGHNFDLVLESKQPFTLTNLLVRKPPRGCTSPIRSGALWISDELPDLTQYSEKYNDFESQSTTTDLSGEHPPNAFFLIPEDQKEIQLEFPKWKAGKFIHVKFISAAKADTRYKNIDVGYLGFVGFHGDETPSQHPVGPISEQLAITNLDKEPVRAAEDIDSEEMRKLKSQLGKGNAAEDGKFIINRTGEKHHLTDESIGAKKTLYLKNLINCQVVIDANCTKIFLESCKSCNVVFNGNILTNIVEVWKVDDSEFFFNTPVYTLQLDICNNLKVQYKNASCMQAIIWAGVEDLAVSLANSKTSMETGFTKMKADHPNLNHDIDQFITRLIEGRFKTEQIVRLANGFPTTEREAAEFELKEERNHKFAEAKIRQIIKTTEMKHNKAPKVGRNDPCPCGKGQKYKKCCGKDK